jgi:hypothetical protein
MNTSSAKKSRKQLQKAIDDEITSLEQSIRESIRVLKSRRNALAPISSLPPEILAAIFSSLSASANKGAFRLKWIYFSHVCRQWRETALNYPHLWNHVNSSKLAPAAIAEMLARAKMAPLHLEVDFTEWSRKQVDAFERQPEEHISHTRHLKVCGPLQMVLKRLVSPAPILEFLSLSHYPRPSAPSRDVIPVNIFNDTTPSLTSLELRGCDIGWKLPLLKGLKTLKIGRIDPPARPKLEDWLDALDEMPQLESLYLQHATPSATAQLMPEPSRTVTLPFLTNFDILASPKNCALALAHLVMPALTSLHVNVGSQEMEGEDIGQLIPYVARNVYGPQDTEPLRSILISDEGMHAKFFAWTKPDAHLYSSFSPRFAFTVMTNWNPGVHTGIFDGLLMHLPVDSVSTITAANNTRLSREFWLNHAPRLPSLEQARLAPSAVKAFRDMLAEDAPPDGPRLPSLTKLTLVNVTLTAPRTFSLRNILIKRVKQGVPLDVLDLFKCVAHERAIQLLREKVKVVEWATKRRAMEKHEILNAHDEIGCWDEVGLEGMRILQYRDTYNYDDEDEDGDEDSDGAEYDTYDDSDYDDFY